MPCDGRVDLLPDDGNAVDQWAIRSSAWRNVAEGIEKAARELRGRASGAVARRLQSEL